MPKTKEQKRKDATFRSTRWAAMSLRERLTYLNNHFPDGAKRQRKKIEERIAKGETS